MEIEKALQKLQTDPWAEDDATKQEILNELRGLGSSVLEHVLTLCRSNLWRDRQKGYRLLGGFGAIEAIWLLEDEKAEGLLIGALQDEAEVARVEAIHSLILIEETKKTGKSIPAVINVLKNGKKPNIRADTAMSLAFIRWDPKVTEALIEALNDHESTKSESFLMGTQYGMSVAAAATEALAKLGDKKGIAAIVPRVLAGMWTVQHTAEVFKYVGEPAVVYLIEGLEMESWQARERAAASLGEIGDDKAVEPLIRTLNDEHWKVRRAAVEALGKLKHPRAVEALIQAVDDESVDVRGKAMDALKRKGQPAVMALIRLLQHGDSGIRQRAAFALSDIGDPSALEALTQAKQDKSWFVRSAAKGAIKNIEKKAGKS